TGRGLHFADYAEALSVNEPIDQLTALDCAILVENKHRHVLYVVIERVAERDHLDQRREKEKKKSQRISPADDELFEQNRAKPSKRFVFDFHVVRLVIPSKARKMPRTYLDHWRLSVVAEAGDEGLKC